MIRSLMQDVPLTLNLVRERVTTLFRDKTVTTGYCGRTESATYGEVLTRCARLASALQEFGIRPGDRVATLAWNSQRHLELYIAVPCMGAVLHTINARLPAAAITSLLARAGDSVLFVDASLAPALSTAALPPTVRQVIVMRHGVDDGGTSDTDQGAVGHDYETLLSSAATAFDWPELDERAPSGLCYTSGTTGTPKGVIYSHRSTTLHTLGCLFADGVALRERDVCMPVVPMFHANGWGFPYAALMAGASLALPYRRTDPESLAALIERAGVTMATAVPTVWLDLLEALRSGRIERSRVGSLARIPMGGAPVSKALIDDFAANGIEVTHCWGMTEISPLGLVNVRKSMLGDAEAETARTAQGLPMPCCQLRIVAADGCEAPRDGLATGELQVRSPWAADGYFDAERDGNRADSVGGVADAFVADSRGLRWLRTGDIASIDGHGYVRIVDRIKDLIKSGGEWISSQALEAHLLTHPHVREAAVVGRKDDRWQERPVAFLTLRAQASTSDETELVAEVGRSLAASFPKWQLPDAYIVVTELPKGNTGKIDKAALRARLATGPGAAT